jgi:GNAT superfamily N-acetyltransferase
MNVSLRTARPEDRDFACAVYLETMRWIIELLFGWDKAREEANFARFFKLDEVSIITADGRDAGWIQEQVKPDAIHLGSLYVAPVMQRRGIGTRVLQGLLKRAASQSKAVTLAVVKMNPALHLYERHGFRITHEDQYKFYMRAGLPSPINAPPRRDSSASFP